METPHREENGLNLILRNKLFAWSLIGLSALLMLIENFLKMDFLVGGWHIVAYLMLLLPLAYMSWKDELKNPYTKWFLPFLLIMVFDMFYYNNDVVQFTVPIIFYILIVILYLTSMQTVHSLYQTFVPSLGKSIPMMSYIKHFFEGLFLNKQDNQLFKRIGLALLITLPFLAIFISLLFSADSNYSQLIKSLFQFNLGFDIHYLITMPLYFFVYLLLFVYGFSNYKERATQDETKTLDLLIVGIFLGMINILFVTFVAMQIPFLLSSDYQPQGISIANFAREGFFQLMWVMGLVVLILLFIMRRFKGEKSIRILLIGLLVQSIIMGMVSLKKMHLYQEIKGATVLRYYVEWFDYFLLIILTLGIVFLVRKYTFTKLLDIIAILGITTFTLIVSLNIDAMVAKHNIAKFKMNPEMLDIRSLKSLSIDALPAISQYETTLNRNLSYPEIASEIFYSSKPLDPEAEMIIEVASDTTRTTTKSAIKHFIPWYEHSKRKNCISFGSYHWGYCATLKKYGATDD